MRTTFILELDPKLATFIQDQPEFTDPSMFVNQVLREEQKRQGVPICNTHIYDDEVHVAMEEFLDQDIQAAD